MKKLLSLFLILICLCACDVVHAQLPFMHATTVIPQNPTTSDFIKIVTHVSTPNQGILVDQLYTVTAVPSKIHLHGCYWQGMATAIQHHIDTFHIGYLQAGTYTLTHSVYMSSTQQHCSRIDSNFATGGFTVKSTVGLNELKKSGSLTLTPNPASESLTLSGVKTPASVRIFSLAGTREKELLLLSGEKIDITTLPPGLYLLTVAEGKSFHHTKFIKE
jgi:hypothetical protein